MASCACGFDFDLIGIDEIEARTTLGVSAIARALTGAGDTARTRPSEDRWSSLEYAAHVRDVMLTIRDRLVIGMVEDNATFKPLYRDERIDFGLYAADTIGDVVAEMRAAAAMFCRLFNAIEADVLERMVQYGHPGPVPRSLEWMGKQVVHEVEHHLGDIIENQRL